MTQTTAVAEKEWTVDVTEFVTKAMNDRDFMLEVFSYIPDSMLKGEGPAGPDERGQMGLVFGRICFPGAQAMGCTFTEEELTAESDRQFGMLKGFGKIKFGALMLKTLKKARSKA